MRYELVAMMHRRMTDIERRVSMLRSKDDPFQRRMLEMDWAQYRRIRRMLYSSKAA